MLRSPRALPRHTHRSGFSILELLIVMGIIGALLGLVAPAVSGILKGKKLEQALSAVSLALENARLEAISQNAYIWVGFTSVSASKSPSSQDELWLMTFRVLPDKKRLPFDTSPDSGTLKALSELTRIEGVSLVPKDSLPYPLPFPAFMTTNGEDFAASRQSGTPASWKLKSLINSSSADFYKLILFTPRGEALRETGDPELPEPVPYLLLCLAPTVNGQILPKNKDAAAVVVSGFSSRITTIRPGITPATQTQSTTPASP